MKILFLHMFAILIILNTSAQVTERGFTRISDLDEPVKALDLDSLDICVLKAQYRMDYIKDVKNPTKRNNNFMLLQIGNYSSKFSDFYSLKGDDIITEAAKQKKKHSEVSSAISQAYRGSTPLNIFKNHKKNEFTTTDMGFLTDYFKHTEDKPAFNWKLQAGAATICGYSCKKATTSFRGRNYTALYASKIAYSDGPWKFWGLPGLILKVTDDKNEYSFECVAIEKGSPDEIIYMKKRDYLNTNRSRFREAMRKSYENPNVYVESMRGIAIPNKTMPYNPIELE